MNLFLPFYDCAFSLYWFNKKQVKSPSTSLISFSSFFIYEQNWRVQLCLLSQVTPLPPPLYTFILCFWFWFAKTDGQDYLCCRMTLCVKCFSLCLQINLGVVMPIGSGSTALERVLYPALSLYFSCSTACSVSVPTLFVAFFTCIASALVERYDCRSPVPLFNLL